jgi:hypothetical protein
VDRVHSGCDPIADFCSAAADRLEEIRRDRRVISGMIIDIKSLSSEVHKKLSECVGSSTLLEVDKVPTP